MRRDPLRFAVPLFGLAMLCIGALAPAAWAVSFAARTDLTTGATPYCVAVGDFNGDGRQDLMVADAGDNTVSLFLGDGSGGFAAKADFGTGVGPRGVAVADFNGDGKLDFATANVAADSVSVRLGNGSGGFAVRTDYPVSDGPGSLAAGDFDNDGDQDLAVVNDWSNTVSILLGNGAGAFGLKTDFATAIYPFCVAVGDFNDDGKKDLGIANGGPQSVSVLLGNGAGGFSPRTDFATASAPAGIAVGDFNGDGKQDLASANSSVSNVGVLLGNGAGGFGARAEFATGMTPYSVAVGDFNCDGRQDLVAANINADNVSILLGDGAGGFGAKTDFATGTKPINVAVGDFNGDGKQDLATANSTVGTASVLLGRFEAPSGSMKISGGATATASRAVTVDVSVTEATQMRVRNAGGAWGEWVPYVHTAAWTLSAGDGVKSVEAQYRNKVGTTDVLSDTILLDTAAPETRDDAASGWVASSPATVTLTPDDGGGSGAAGTQYRVDAAASWSEGTSVQIAADGMHTLRYRSVDAVGNVGETEFTTVRLDATAPVASVSGVDDLWHRAPVLALFAATDATSGVAGVSYQLDAGAWTPVWGVLVSGDGDHVLQYKAADMAGNESAPATVHVKIDTVGPVTSGLAASARAGKKASFKVLVTDPLCPGATTSAKVVIKSKAGKTLKTLPSVPVVIGTQATVTWARCTLKRGTYKYVVLAADAAGNPQSKAGGNKLVVK